MSEAPSSPETSPKPFVFVLMPFKNEFDDVYHLGIKGACEKADVYCERVDEQVFPETILQRVYNQIAKADIIIADMTGQNPNVFYEVGYAHALNKAVILVTQKVEDIPFDLKHYTHIIYGGHIAQLKDDLVPMIRYWREHPRESMARAAIGLELYVNGEAVTDNMAVIPRKHQLFTVACHNPTDRVFKRSSVEIGLEVPESVVVRFAPGLRMTHGSPRSTEIPGSKRLYVFEVNATLFPGGWFNLPLELNDHRKHQQPFDTLVPFAANSSTIGTEGNTTCFQQGPPVPCTIHVYSDAGTRSYSLSIQFIKAVLNGR